ncbi:MAG: InlB B-repeat-containing protein, partial [Kiritimatiellae bacterium]|nr:InlB B-repeat-containing protein [Kiritimatiellia bacterium]
MKKLAATLAAALGLAVGAMATTWDLSTKEAWLAMPSSGIANGDVATGLQPSDVRQPLKIAAGATVTLRDISINKSFYTGGDNAGVVCLGDATLVLEGVNTVIGFHSACPGVFIPQGKTLTIKGGGTLSAGSCGMGYGAGIGGGWGISCGNIVIESGAVYGQSTMRGAGIGAGGGGGSCGSITINGGLVVANGGYGLVLEDQDVYEGGAGIGGGDNSNCGNITINGGSVIAVGRASASGIGGSTKSCGNITINGGTVTAKGGEGAGIGGGTGGCGNITINGGTVTARGGTDSAGIGCGKYGLCSDITIGADVVSVCASSGTGCDTEIGAGTGGACSSVSINRSLARMTVGSTLYLGAINLSTLSENITVGNGMILTGELDASRQYKVTIASDATVTLRDVSIKGRNLDDCKWAGITCEGGRSTIILEGRNTVKGFHRNYPGIYVPVGAKLTIKGDGYLTASSNGYAAGIGGGNGTALSNGDINIVGGIITAFGGISAAGIGSGSGGDCGSITIGSGVTCVTAMCGEGVSDPIGPGRNGSGGAVTLGSGLGDVISGNTRTIAPNVVRLASITGDTTVTDGGVLTGTLGVNCKISIAAGATVTLSDVTINGVDSGLDHMYPWAGLTCLGDATIILEGKNSVSGFDYGYPGILVPGSHTLTIRGSGSLEARGREHAAGIGGGSSNQGGNVIIEGGEITATGGEGASGIGGGDDTSFGNITINGGIVKATGGANASGIGGGQYESCGDISIGGDAGKVVATCGGGGAKPIGAAKNGASGTFSVADVLFCMYSSDGMTCTVMSGDLGKLSDGDDVTFTDGAVLTGCLLMDQCKLSIADGATVTLRDATIVGYNYYKCEWAGLNCLGDATIVLEGENYVQGFDQHYPGIHVAEGGTLTIKGEGKLEARSGGYEYGAGIGGGWHVSCGNIVIEGGEINAIGGTWSAGIGSGADSTCGSIEIKGGTVVATGGTIAAGIGAGAGDAWPSVCGDIRITGGTVTATGNGDSSAGIGCGQSGQHGDIYIGSGIVKVVATSGAASHAPIGCSHSKCGSVTVGSGLSDTTSGNVRTIHCGQTYMVQFHKYDGSGTTQNQEFKVGETKSLLWFDSQLGWKREGYEFIGWVPWNPDSKPRLCKYVNGQKVKDLAKVGETFHLWAAWKSSSSYRVCFNRNDGSGEKMNQVILRNKEDSLAWMDSQIGWKRAGYSFQGWAETATGAVKYANG